ncbi:MAG: TPMT family class I SAM-dependent methyltransferase [Rhodocyclaceae bacterium]|nr:TPMT family class I SAM-dependent methyltransferase [Rhodocyclaceae bacterium]
MSGPTPDFWQARFLARDMPWDRGEANSQLGAWLAAGILPAGARILVPGCGQGWEVVLLAEQGFQVTGIDIASAALELCKAHLAQRGLSARLVQGDVLNWQPDEPVDAVFEQTCLCALHPDDWQAYAEQLHRWLVPGGKLMALFMQAPRPEDEEGVIGGPPYHCPMTAMRALFPARRWHWPAPPYARCTHERLGRTELAVVLIRR